MLQARINEIQKEEGEDDSDNEGDEDDEDIAENCIKRTREWFRQIGQKCAKPFEISDQSEFKSEEDDFFTAVYKPERREYFDLKDGAEITDGQRIQMVENALRHTKFGPGKDEVGIIKLIGNAFEKAYPLHDGFYKNMGQDKPDPPSLRMYLHQNWARFVNIFKIQPLDQIRNYYGEKIALYFAFMGYYTYWLILFSIVGAAVMFFGIGTINDSEYVDEMCAMDKVMCPSCDQTCNYWNFNQTCSNIKFTYIFENYFTLAYAFIVSIWATTFLEFWKRKNATLVYDWDLTRVDEDQEPIRENYRRHAEKINKRRVNPTTLHHEPYVPLSDRLPRKFFSFTFVIFSILLVLGAVIAIIVYRLTVEALLADATFVQGISDSAEDTFLEDYISPSLISSVTASVISLAVIIVLNAIYTVVAGILTEYELPRTQQQFDDSYAFKVFCFQFVNYYSTLFYIAFFKDPLSGHPGK